MILAVPLLVIVGLVITLTIAFSRSSSDSAGLSTKSEVDYESADNPEPESERF